MTALIWLENYTSTRNKFLFQSDPHSTENSCNAAKEYNIHNIIHNEILMMRMNFITFMPLDSLGKLLWVKITCCIFTSQIFFPFFKKYKPKHNFTKWSSIKNKTTRNIQVQTLARWMDINLSYKNTWTMQDSMIVKNIHMYAYICIMTERDADAESEVWM